MGDVGQNMIFFCEKGRKGETVNFKQSENIEDCVSRYSIFNWKTVVNEEAIVEGMGQFKSYYRTLSIKYDRNEGRQIPKYVIRHQ